MRSARPWWSKVDSNAANIAQVVDAEIDGLSHESRSILAAIWQERGSSELRVAGGFSALAAQLIEHGTADGVLKLVSRAVRDEVHHAEIAVDMASRYRASDAIEWPPPLSFPVPVLAPAEGRLRATLLVIAMCCINETLACGILEGQLSLATSPLTRAALQSVLADEIDHARAGWAHLATPFVTTTMKHEIADWLPRLLSARLQDLVVEDAPFPGEQFPAHGILTRKARKEIVASGLASVVLPGFARAGIDPAKAEEWARGTFHST